jgi:hypothetical protein
MALKAMTSAKCALELAEHAAVHHAIALAGEPDR